MNFRHHLAVCGALASLALAAGAAARADTLINYTFDPGSTFSVGCCNYLASGGFTYDATTNTISNVTYDLVGSFFFTAATVTSPTDVTFTGDCCGDETEYFFARSLALGGTDTITGGALPSNLDFSASASGSVTAGVPEPAGWALMLLGFGALGVSLRVRPKASLA